MKYNKLIALACGALILAGCASDNKSTSVFFRHKAQEIPLSNEFTEKIIDNIYQRMSMDERAAQLQSMYLSELFDKNNQLDTVRCYELIPNGIGHFAQYASNSLDGPEELRDMVKQVQEWLVKNTPTGIPALFHEEVITGIAAKKQRFTHSKLVWHVRSILTWLQKKLVKLLSACEKSEACFRCHLWWM